MFKSNTYRGKLYFEYHIPGVNNKFRNETEIMQYEDKCKTQEYHTTIYCEACLKRELNDCKLIDLIYTKKCSATNCSNLSFNPCMNGGTCLNLDKKEKDPLSFVHFKCECAPGYSGLLCLSFKVCDLNPCKSGKCVAIGELGLFYCVTESGQWINGLKAANGSMDQEDDHAENVAINLLFVNFFVCNIFCYFLFFYNLKI